MVGAHDRPRRPLRRHPYVHAPRGDRRLWRLVFQRWPAGAGRRDHRRRGALPDCGLRGHASPTRHDHRRHHRGLGHSGRRDGGRLGPRPSLAGQRSGRAVRAPAGREIDVPERAAEGRRARTARRAAVRRPRAGHSAAAAIRRLRTVRRVPTTTAVDRRPPLLGTQLRRLHRASGDRGNARTRRNRSAGRSRVVHRGVAHL